MKKTVLLVLFARTAMAQTPNQAAPKPPQAYMEATRRAMTPGPEHRRLAAREGSYTTSQKFWFNANSTPVESTGSAKLRMILDGRFLQEENEGQSGGQAFRGLRLYGFDNASHSYEGVWLYTGGTGIMQLHGSSSDAGRSVVFAATFTDATGQPQTFEVRISDLDRDRFLVTLLGKAPDGKLTGLRQETTYTRKP